jgi:hypothetical protein
VRNILNLSLSKSLENWEKTLKCIIDPIAKQMRLPMGGSFRDAFISSTIMRLFCLIAEYEQAKHESILGITWDQMAFTIIMLEFQEHPNSSFDFPNALLPLIFEALNKGTDCVKVA